jgi:hypothetical protein
VGTWARGRGRRALAAAVAVTAIAAACGVPSGFDHIDPSYTGVLITSDATAPSNQYDLSAQNGSPLSQVSLSADATNTAGNLRTVFYPAGQTPTESGQVCATWQGPETPDELPQQGLAARIETNPTGVRRGITITKNIWGPAYLMNVNLWTLNTAGTENTLSNITTDYSAVVTQDGGAYVPFPWQVCAQVAGNTVTMDVETGTNPPAPFTDTANVKTVTLPDGWDYTGHFGWYIGHMHGGETFNYTNLNAITPLRTTTTTSTTIRS